MSTHPFASRQIPDLVLANPTAGGGLAGRALPLLQGFAKQHQWQAEFRTAGSAAEFAQIAQAEAARGRERVFALGGDGTFQVLLNALANFSNTSIGVLPAGGGNDLACALGLPLDPIKAAEVLLHQGEACSLDVARACTSNGAERLYMGGGGIGLDAEAAQFASGAYRKIRGRSRYLISAIRALCKFHPVGVRISFKGSGEATIEGKVLVAGVLNTPSYGAGLRLAPQAKLDDGMLDLAILGGLGLLEILRILPALAISGELHTDHIQRFPIRQARIETERPCLFHGDGELIGQTPVEISVVPHAVKVWRPAKTDPNHA